MGPRMYALIAALAALVLTLAANVAVREAARGVRVDFTGEARYSLSPASLKTIRALSEPLSLTFFVSRDALAQDPARRAFAERVGALLASYEAASGGRLRVQALDPKPRSPAEEAAIQAGVAPLETGWGRNSVYLGLAGRNTLDESATLPQLRLKDEGRLEADITALIARLEQPDAPAPPVPARSVQTVTREAPEAQRVARRLAEAEAALARSSPAAAEPLRAQVVALRRELRAAQAAARVRNGAEEGWLLGAALVAPLTMLSFAGAAAWRRRENRGR